MERVFVAIVAFAEDPDVARDALMRTFEHLGHVLWLPDVAAPEMPVSVQLFPLPVGCLMVTELGPAEAFALAARASIVTKQIAHLVSTEGDVLRVQEIERTVVVGEPESAPTAGGEDTIRQLFALLRRRYGADPKASGWQELQFLPVPRT